MIFIDELDFVDELIEIYGKDCTLEQLGVYLKEQKEILDD